MKASGYGRTFGLILMTVSVLYASNQSMQHLAVLARKWIDLRYRKGYVAQAH